MRTAQPYAGENDLVDVLRKLVALLYREVGVLLPQNHEVIAGRRKLDSGFFPDARKLIAHRVYQATKNDADPLSTENRLTAITGLSLEDIETAFAKGNWRNSYGTVSFGGPLWAETARVTLALRAAILYGNEAEARRIASVQVPELRHNHGRVIDKFEDLGPK